MIDLPRDSVSIVVDRATEAGRDAHLAKPVQIKEMIEVIARCYGKLKELRRRRTGKKFPSAAF